MAKKIWNMGVYVLSILFRLVWHFNRSRWIHLFCRLVRNAGWAAKLGHLGETPNIYRDVIIHCPENVRIGDRVVIAEFVHMWGGGGIEIGDDVIVASHAIITSQTHDPDTYVYRNTDVLKEVTIEGNVWIGAGAIILPGVHIGRGAVVGAGSVVTRDISSNTIVAGNPARVLRRAGGG